MSHAVLLGAFLYYVFSPPSLNQKPRDLVGNDSNRLIPTQKPKPSVPPDPTPVVTESPSSTLKANLPAPPDSKPVVTTSPSPSPKPILPAPPVSKPVVTTSPSPMVAQRQADPPARGDFVEPKQPDEASPMTKRSSASKKPDRPSKKPGRRPRPGAVLPP